MGEQLLLECFFWFDKEARHRNHPNGFTLAAKFRIGAEAAQSPIPYFRDCLQTQTNRNLPRQSFRNPASGPAHHQAYFCL